MSVFVVLGVIWAAVLVPPLLRARSERREEFIDHFRHQMGALGDKAKAVRNAEPGALTRARLGPGLHPARRVSPAKRRRDILGGLLGAMIGSLLLGAIPSLRIVWVLGLFLVNVFLGYVTLLVFQRRHAAMLRRSRTRARAQMPAARPQTVLKPVQPVLHLRTGSGR